MSSMVWMQKFGNRFIVHRIGNEYLSHNFTRTEPNRTELRPHPQWRSYEEHRDTKHENQIVTIRIACFAYNVVQQRKANWAQTGILL